MLLIDLERKNLIKPPSYLTNNTMYLCRMGSVAYGVSTDTSDVDMYGVCIPPVDYIFPKNYIHGFDQNIPTFNVWQEHQVKDKSRGCEYDFNIYNISHFFQMVMDNNPNALDSLFVRREHIVHSTRMWEIVLENKKLFLHKGVTHKMKGYAYSQLDKAKNCVEYVKSIRDFENTHSIPHNTTFAQAKTIDTLSGSDFAHYMSLWEEGLHKTKRFESQKIHNTDIKFLYHVFRLVDQAEFILNHHDLDLQEPSRVEKMKAIRRGDLTYDQIVSHFHAAELRLNDLYQTSSLQMRPDKKEIRTLLLSVLEDHYGSLEKFIKPEDANKQALDEIRSVFRKYNL